MKRFYDKIRFLQLALRAYELCGDRGSSYLVLTRDGIPRIAIFVGTGREAWRITQRAAEEFCTKRVDL